MTTPKLREIELVDADETFIYRAETDRGELFWETPKWPDLAGWMDELVRAWREEADDEV